jgi:hypothetical protein
VHPLLYESEKTNLMQLYKKFIVEGVMALHVSGVCAHRQERQDLKLQHMVFCNIKKRLVKSSVVLCICWCVCVSVCVLGVLRRRCYEVV